MSATTTTDHKTIRSWIQKRGGVPATVESTGETPEDIGVLRIDFPHGDRNDNLSTISWESFFEKFEDAELAFLHADKTSEGDLSRFCKFVNRHDNA